MIRDLEDYEQIEEDHVRARAELTKSASLAHLLKIADEWRAADCTPVFIVFQEDPMILACVSEESFGKYHH